MNETNIDLKIFIIAKFIIYGYYKINNESLVFKDGIIEYFQRNFKK